MQLNKRSKIIVLVASSLFAAIVLILYGVKYFTAEREQSYLEEQQKRNLSSKTAKENTKTNDKDNSKGKDKQKEPPIASEKIEVDFSSIDTPLAGNLYEITALRAELEKKRLQAQIAKEDEKIPPNEGGAQPAAPTTLHPTQIVAPPEPIKSVPPKTTVPVVISIQGYEGSISATMRTHNGDIRTVRPGDKFEGGTISSISQRGVETKRGQLKTTFLFE